MSEENFVNRILRAPSGKFYIVWRGKPLCLSNGVMLYFDTENQAREILIESEAEDIHLNRRFRRIWNTFRDE